VYAVPLIFYFITFYIRAFSMVVQGFSATNWFNYRYSFVFSFLMILIACEEFPALRYMEQADFKKACGLFAAFVALVFGQRYGFVTGGGMLLGLALLLACLGVIWWNRVDPKRAPANLMTILLVLLCSIESYANYVICTGNLKDWGGKASDYQKDLFSGSILVDAVRQSDPSFYRMENEHSTNGMAANDPRLFGYNGLIYFGSCESNFVFQGLSKLGMSWWSNRMWYSGGKPSAFDTLLGLKYIVSERDLTEEKGYKQLIDLEGHKLFLNANALPIAILSAPDKSDLSLTLNPFDNHNALWKSLTGADEDVFDQLSEIEFTYHAGLDGTKIDQDQARGYSASVTTAAASSASTSVESTSNSVSESPIVRDVETIRQGYNVECRFIAKQDGPIYGYNGLAVDERYGYAGEAMYCIGIFHKGDVVTDYIPLNGPATEGQLKMFCAEYYAACPNRNVLETYCSKLQNDSGTLEKVKDSYLIGHVNAAQDGRLFFTFPYDEGWTLTVDGQNTPLIKTADLFMSADIGVGEHSYSLRFLPKGMRFGRYISCGSLVLLGLLIVYNITARRQTHKEEA